MLKNVIKRVLQYQKEKICKEIMGGGVMNGIKRINYYKNYS